MHFFLRQKFPMRRDILRRPMLRLPIRRRIQRCALIFLAAVCCVAPHARGQELAQRLVLKDGSYQLVTKYEVHGDRVRYMSAERNDWEELPSDLVDWPATEKFEKERSKTSLAEAAAVDREKAEEEKAETASHLPEVAPGLRLPDDSGVFLLDTYQGQPQLVEIQQMEGDIDRNAKANILRGVLAPLAKQSVELDGEHAAVNAHVSVPSIYISMENDPNQPPAGQTDSARPSEPSLDAPRDQPQQPQQPQQAQGPVVPFDRFRIVRAKIKSGKRTISDLKRNAAGKVSENQDVVKTTIDKIGGGWFKLTPVEALTPGEYALIEMKGAEGMNLYVWDFGVNPSGPANANPWKPEK